VIDHDDSRQFLHDMQNIVEGGNSDCGVNHQTSSAVSASSGIIKSNFFNISFSAGDNQPSVFA
jgi:hypothetical protein